MLVPTYDTFIFPLLNTLDDGQEHNVRDLREVLAGEFKLTAAKRHELLPSGK